MKNIYHQGASWCFKSRYACGPLVTMSTKADTCMSGQISGSVPAFVFCMLSLHKISKLHKSSWSLHVINFYRVNNLTYFLKFEDITTKLGQKVVEVSPNISNEFSCGSVITFQRNVDHLTYWPTFSIFKIRQLYLEEVAHNLVLLYGMSLSDTLVSGCLVRTSPNSWGCSFVIVWFHLLYYYSDSRKLFILYEHNFLIVIYIITKHGIHVEGVGLHVQHEWLLYLTYWPTFMVKTRSTLWRCLLMLCKHGIISNLVCKFLRLWPITMICHHDLF